MCKKVLAFDFGASSGRAMLGEFDRDAGQIRVTEIRRFENNPVFQNGTMYWDVLRLLHEMKQSILAAQKYGRIDGIGIDTWGVDFGMIDRNGQLLANPVNYRDKRTEGMPQEVFQILPQSEIYKHTGTQFMRINTLYQLHYLNTRRKELLSLTDKILLMPDLFAYFLTGCMRTEITEASTTNLFNPNRLDWDDDILKALSLDRGLFADFIRPGEMYGMLSDAICGELGCEKIPVFAVTTHDTASAVVSASLTESSAYISCGTWSLMGVELQKPVITKESEQCGITNEIGHSATVRFLKNIMGLWLIQQSKRHWEMEMHGEKLTWPQLCEEARSAQGFRCYVDCDAPEFEIGENLPLKVQEFCRRTGQYVPQTRAEIACCIYQSLAMKYKYTIKLLEKATGKKIDRINMVGGGIQDTSLCQNTASATNCTVVAGPVEATVMGNLSVQFIALGEIKDIPQARQVIANSAETVIYTPKDVDLWDQHFETFCKAVGLEKIDV